MAKKSLVARNKKRYRIVAKYLTERKELKKIINDLARSPEERQTAWHALLKQPRDASPVRIRRRCELTGRGRGNYRKFGICRHKIRDLARFGHVAGLLKSSW